MGKYVILFDINPAFHSEIHKDVLQIIKSVKHFSFGNTYVIEAASLDKAYDLFKDIIPKIKNTHDMEFSIQELSPKDDARQNLPHQKFIFLHPHYQCNRVA